MDEWMIRTRVLERYDFGGWKVDAVGDLRMVGGGKGNGFIEVFQELSRKCVLRVRSVQRDAIHARKAFSLLHVSLGFGNIYDWHGELSYGT